MLLRILAVAAFLAGSAPAVAQLTSEQGGTNCSGPVTKSQLSTFAARSNRAGDTECVITDALNSQDCDPTTSTGSAIAKCVITSGTNNTWQAIGSEVTAGVSSVTGGTDITCTPTSGDVTCNADGTLARDTEVPSLEQDPVFGAMDTETELETQLTDVTDVFTNNDGALTDDDLTDDSVGELQDVTLSGTPQNRDVLVYDGVSAFVDRLLVEADISNLQHTTDTGPAVDCATATHVQLGDGSCVDPATQAELDTHTGQNANVAHGEVDPAACTNAACTVSLANDTVTGGTQNRCARFDGSGNLVSAGGDCSSGDTDTTCLDTGVNCLFAGASAKGGAATSAAALENDALDSMVEIATTLKVRADDTDTKLLTTSISPPASDTCLEMDSNGSVVLASAACGTGSGGAPGTDTVGTDELDDGANSPTAGYAVIVDSGTTAFEYVDPATQAELDTHTGNTDIHVDHTAVSVTAGDGLTGGGDISATRNFAVGAGTGIAVNANDVQFDYADAGTDPALGADECVFSNEGTSDGGWVCEGPVADSTETRFRVTESTTTDKIITFPDATGEVTLLGQSIDDGELTETYCQQDKTNCATWTLGTDTTAEQDPAACTNANCTVDLAGDTVTGGTASRCARFDGSGNLVAAGGDCSAGDTDTTLSGSAAGGDLSGTYPNPSVNNDSHNHGDTTVDNNLTIAGGAIGTSAITLNAGTAPTTDGLIEWDTTDERIKVGDDGAATLEFYPGAHTVDTTLAGTSAGGDLTGTYPNPTIAGDAVALGTDTTGNYVATVAPGTGSKVTVTGSGSEGAAVTLGLSTLTIGTDTTAELDPDACSNANCTVDITGDTVTGGTASRCARFDGSGNLVAAGGDCSSGDTTIANTTCDTDTCTLDDDTIVLLDANGAAPTTDGEIKYDRTTERIEVGDGTNTVEFYSGDHTATAITDGLIVEADLNEDSGTPTDEDVLTYDSTGGNFLWVAQNTLDAGTAIDLAANGANCAAGEIPLGVDTKGAVEGCYEPAFTDVTGSVTDAQVPNDITIDLAATATALAANGGNCAAGEIPLGVDASGAVEGCYEPAFSDVTGAVTDAQVPNDITIDLATKASTVTVADISGDTTSFVALTTDATGSLSVDTDAGITYNATSNVLTATGFAGNLTGTADFADKLSLDPTDCASGEFANAIDKEGDLTCATVGLDTLSDVNITGPLQNRDVLIYDSTATEWVDRPLVEADISGLVHFTNSDETDPVFSAETTLSALETRIGTTLVPTSQKGAVSGVASLDGSAKVPVSQLPDSVVGSVKFAGTWNANTNSPNLTTTGCQSSPGDEGNYYVVSTAGSTNLDGETQWEVGDWAICEDDGGLAWARVGAGSRVTSVHGRVGAVTANTSDYDAAQIDNTPANNIVATDVQAALNELDSEKLAIGATAGGALDGTYPNPSILDNAVALGTKTTGNYVATIADAGNGKVTVANSGTETAAVTLDIADVFVLNTGDTIDGSTSTNLTITGGSSQGSNNLLTVEQDNGTDVFSINPSTVSVDKGTLSVYQDNAAFNALALQRDSFLPSQEMMSLSGADAGKVAADDDNFYISYVFEDDSPALTTVARHYVAQTDATANSSDSEMWWQIIDDETFVVPFQIDNPASSAPQVQSHVQFVVDTVTGDSAVQLPTGSISDTETADNLTIAGGTIGTSDITLKSGTAPTADGRIEWDSTAETIKVGDDNTGTLEFHPGAHFTSANETDPVFAAVDTEAELESHLTDVTNVFTNNDGALDDDDLTDDTIGTLSDVSVTGPLASGDVLIHNGSAFVDRPLTAGDIASGTLAHERGGLEADVSGYDGLVRISSGTTTNITNLSGLNTALGSSIADGAHNADQNLFATVDVPTGTDPSAGSTTDTLTLANGSGIGITGSATNTVTIAATLGDSISAAEMANEDHGDVAWDSGVAEVQSMTTSAIGADTSVSIAMFGEPSGTVQTIHTDPGLVYDATNNVLTSTDHVTIGDTEYQMTIEGGAYTSRLAVSTDSGDNSVAEIEAHRHGNTAARGAVVYGVRSRGSVGSEAVVQSGDRLLTLYALGFDGTDQARAAEIDFTVGGTPGSDDMPGAIAFKTSADGSQSPTTRLTIDEAGVSTFSGNVVISATGNDSLQLATGAISDDEVADDLTIAGGTIGTSAITLVQGTAPTPTAEGVIEWDTDDDHIYVGKTGGAAVFVPAEGVSGDILMTNAGAATIQQNSVALGTDTTGNYVADVTGATGRITVTGTAGEGWAPEIDITADSLVEADLDATNTPSGSGDVLTYDATSLGFTWATQSSLSVGSASTATSAATANAGDSPTDFFSAGAIVAQDDKAVTDLEGTGLSITNNTLNASARSVEVFTPSNGATSVTLANTPTAVTAVSCAMTGYTLSRVASGPSTGQFSVSGTTVTLGLAVKSGDDVVCTYTYS